MPLGGPHPQVVGKPCSRVASFLLGETQESPIVGWQRDPLRKQGQAIADGYLRFDTEIIENSRSLTKSMKSKLLKVANKFPELGVYEFKSLRFAEGETFDAILQIIAKGTYDWIRCNPDECKKSHYKGGRPQVTCARMGLDAEPGLSFLPPQPNALGGGGKKRGREADDLIPSFSPTVPDTDWEHAHFILQQVYAEAVAQDATFLVIQCGNREIIGVRNRKHQTLHLSGVHEFAATTGPSYVQVHVGLYLATILDAVERASGLEKLTKVPATWDDDWNKSAMRKSRQLSPETLLALAHKLPTVILHSSALHTPTNGKDLHFLRLLTEGDRLGGPVMQIVKAIQTNNSERTYQATLRVNGQNLQANVYLKLARSPSNRAMLLHEYHVCQELARKHVRGVPDVIGCFSYQGPIQADDGMGSDPALDLNILAMISVDGGVPVTKEDDDAPKSFVRLLQQIHQSGYLHGLIRAEHVLVDGRKVMMVSFGHAAPYNSAGAAAELEDLYSLLNQGRKRRRHFASPPEKAVVIESHTICHNPANLFVSLTSHVALIGRMLKEKGIRRVLYEEHEGNTRFTIHFRRGTRAAIAFSEHWLQRRPDELRRIGCEVRDTDESVASSEEIEVQELAVALLSATVAGSRSPP
ncbi:hypothetical protein BDN71DRAFT_1594400 [Pleurotus eryngii]|uniref:Protein kinase domain-containing protein n=1 Tax=Pleurotus eryngii TaxID=5323 RepID=A0A9P6D9G5_PLEER|nr:hypothetical protein BDN71DRAFT_1594400 [Pleurotus eryngii]